jgi:hypothetical protein
MMSHRRGKEGRVEVGGFLVFLVAVASVVVSVVVAVTAGAVSVPAVVMAVTAIVAVAVAVAVAVVVAVVLLVLLLVVVGALHSASGQAPHATTTKSYTALRTAGRSLSTATVRQKRSVKTHW